MVLVADYFFSEEKLTIANAFRIARATVLVAH
jgi:hypothetical protein